MSVKVIVSLLVAKASTNRETDEINENGKEKQHVIDSIDETDKNKTNVEEKQSIYDESDDREGETTARHGTEQYNVNGDERQHVIDNRVESDEISSIGEVEQYFGIDSDEEMQYMLDRSYSSRDEMMDLMDDLWFDDR